MGRVMIYRQCLIADRSGNSFSEALAAAQPDTISALYMCTRDGATRAQRATSGASASFQVVGLFIVRLGQGQSKCSSAGAPIRTAQRWYKIIIAREFRCAGRPQPHGVEKKCCVGGLHRMIAVKTELQRSNQYRHGAAARFCQAQRFDAHSRPTKQKRRVFPQPKKSPHYARRDECFSPWCCGLLDWLTRRNVFPTNPPAMPCLIELCSTLLELSPSSACGLQNVPKARCLQCNARLFYLSYCYLNCASVWNVVEKPRTPITKLSSTFEPRNQHRRALFKILLSSRKACTPSLHSKPKTVRPHAARTTWQRLRDLARIHVLNPSRACFTSVAASRGYTSSSAVACQSLRQPVRLPTPCCSSIPTCVSRGLSKIHSTPCSSCERPLQR